MSAVLEAPEVESVPESDTPADFDVTKKLRKQFVAVRLTHTKFGNQKSLNSNQKERAAAPFNAKSRVLSASRKLLDTKHGAYRAVLASIRNAAAFWKNATSPYPMEGIRLLAKEDLADFAKSMERRKAALTREVANLEACRDDLKERARNDQGELFDESMYPSSFLGRFSVDWEVVNVDPSEELKRLSPAIYKEAMKLADARLNAAAALAEQEFAKQLHEMAANLAEKLSGKTVDGKKKVLHASAIENLQELFDRYKKLSIGTNPALDNAFKQVELAIGGVKGDSAKFKANTLKKDVHAAQTIGEAVSNVAKAVESMIVEAPSRSIALE